MDNGQWIKNLSLYTSRYTILLLSGSLILYLGLSFYQINLPGLHYDEAFEAVPAMQLWLGQPVTAFRESTLSIGSLSLPLMTQDYIGAINTYTALPFIAIFGPTPAGLRTMSIMVGAITLLLTFIVGQQLTGQRWVGLAAATILAVDPTFIFWNRQGVFVTAVTATISLVVTYCGSKRLHSGSKYWSITAAFFCGLGIYAKFLFVWFIAALMGAIVLLNLSWLFQHRHELSNRVKQISMAEVLLTIPALLLGCLPLIVYNLQTGGTFLNISQNASTSYYEVNNLAFGSNLRERLDQFGTLLRGDHFWYLGGVFNNYWMIFAFAGIMFAVVILAIRKQVTPWNGSSNLSKNSNIQPGPFSAVKAALFPFMVISLVILASIATVSALWITHYAILMPWPALAITTGMWFIHLNFPKNSEGYKFITIVGASIVLITNLTNTIHYHRVLTESGGLSSHSDAVYDLSKWLTQHAQGQVAAMDWGLAAPVIYLSGGQVKATEVFGYAWQSDVQLSERLAGPISQADTLYLWRSPDEIIFDRSAEFKTLYGSLNLEENIEEAFYEKSGRPILGVTRLVEKGTAVNPP